MTVLQGRPGQYWADCYAIRVHVDHDPVRAVWVAHVGSSILASSRHLEEMTWRLEEISPQQVAHAVASAARSGGER